MNQSQAEQAVVISAFTVAGIYAYRRFTEPSAPPATAKKLLGVGELPPLGSFATAWGFTFLIVAAMAEVSPGLGGSFAILIATADFLTNSSSVFTDVTKQEKGSAGSASAPASTPASASTGPSDPAASTGLPPLQPAPAFAAPELPEQAVSPYQPISTVGHGAVP